jgi:hypothetical protein
MGNSFIGETEGQADMLIVIQLFALKKGSGLKKTRT